MILLLSLSIFFIFPYNSFAWSCADSLDIKDLYKKHDSVFIGKVLETSKENVGTLNPKSRVTFEVKSILKGNHEGNVTVVTTAGSVFLKDKDYLVYAYKTTEDNYLYKYEEGEFATDIMCGGTKELSLANNDLEQLADVKNSFKLKSGITISAAILTMIIAYKLLMKRKQPKN